MTNSEDLDFECTPEPVTTNEDGDFVPGVDYWVVVALNYNKESAPVMEWSSDFIAVDGEINYNDLMDDSAIGGIEKWIKDAVPGLWKIFLKPWSEQSYEGEWDGGWDICDTADAKPKLLVAFPDLS